jgi:hypothetical protein
MTPRAATEDVRLLKGMIRRPTRIHSRDERRYQAVGIRSVIGLNTNNLVRYLALSLPH